MADLYAPVFQVGNDILDIGSRKARRQRGSDHPMAPASAMMGTPAQFDVPNVTNVRLRLRLLSFQNDTIRHDAAVALYICCICICICICIYFTNLFEIRSDQIKSAGIISFGNCNSFINSFISSIIHVSIRSSVHPFIHSIFSHATLF